MRCSMTPIHDGKRGTTMIGTPHLVRMVDASVGEALAGLLAGAVADVVVFSTVHDLEPSDTAGWIQIIGPAALVVAWVAGLLTHRPRQRRQFAAAVALTAMPDLTEESRRLRQGRLRVALLAVAVTLGGAYLADSPLLGVCCQLMLLLGAENNWSTARQWERRHGVQLWKPALAAVGRAEFRRAPYYVTPAGPTLTP